MHALVLESQPLVALMVEDELRQLGFSVEIATTESEAVAAASRQCPDLITSSALLNAGSGIEAVRRIRARQAVPTIYIVSNREEAPSASADSIILGKPMVRSELQHAVQQVTQGSRTPTGARHGLR